MTGLTAKRIKIVLFLTALALRLVILPFIPVEPIGENDSVFFWLFANNLAEGKGYAQIEGIPEGSWNPGYAFFLAPFAFITNGAENVAVPLIVIVQAVLSALLAPLLFILAEKLFNNKKVSVFAGIIAVIVPAFIFHSKALMSELLGMFLLTLAFVLIVEMLSKKTSKLHPVLTGGILGFLVFVRSEYYVLLLVGILIGAFLWVKKRDSRFFAAFLIALMFISLWTARNYVAFGEFVPVSFSVWNAAFPALRYWEEQGRPFKEFTGVADKELEEYQASKNLFA